MVLKNLAFGLVAVLTVKTLFGPWPVFFRIRRPTFCKLFYSENFNIKNPNKSLKILSVKKKKYRQRT